MDNILDALRQLDPLNDDHWTANGDPRIEAVKVLLGADITRGEIVSAAPDFNREKAARPDELLMNKDLPKMEDQLVSEKDTGEAVVDLGVTALDFLADHPDEKVSSIIRRFMNGGKAMTDAEMNFLSKTLDEDEIATLVSGTGEMLVRVSKHNTEMKKFEDGVRRNEMLAKKALAIVRPEPTNDQAIQTYIKAQHDARMKAARTRKAVLQNFDLKDINPVAPIDQAMARRNDRGKKRPVWPGLNK